MILLYPADREVQRILLELLNQMDGFDQTVNVKVSHYRAIRKIVNYCKNVLLSSFLCGGVSEYYVAIL